MDGLIEQARGASESSSPGKGSLTVTPDKVRGEMKLPDDMSQPYDRIVTAAKKMLYSEQIKPYVQEMLQSQGTDGEKIGRGVVMLLSLLYDRANGNLPPQLLIPAATELVAEVADLLSKSGMDITDDDVAEGMATMIEEFLTRAGVEPEQLPELLAQAQGPQAQGPQEPTADQEAQA